MLILLIALLPMRAWAGDAMAFSMGVPPGANPAVACHDAAASTASAAAHQGAHHHSPATETAAHDHGASGHGTCTVCDICHGPAMTLTGYSDRFSPPSHARTIPASERFASALSQRGSKPPIA